MNIQASYFIFFALVAYIVICEVGGRKKWSFSLILLLIPVSTDLFSKHGVNLSLAAVLTLISGLFLSKNNVRAIINSGILIITLVFFTLISLFIGLAIEFNEGVEGNKIELLTYSVYPLLILLFYAKFKLFFYSNDADRIILIPFLSGIIANLASIIFVMYYDGYNIPDFFKSSIASIEETVGGVYGSVQRYGGLIGDYELLVDYCFVVISMSIVLVIKGYKLFPVIIIGCALSVGIMSGTRSFVVGLGIGATSYYFLSVIVSQSFGSAFKGLLVILVAYALFPIVYDSVLKDFLVFQRLELSFDLLGQGQGIEKVINRKFGETISLVLDHSTILGLGAYEHRTLFDNEIVSHNLILATYLRYGFIGVVALLYFYGRALSNLIKVAIKSHCKVEYYVSLVLATTLIVCGIQEMKISALRSMTGVFIYVVLFSYIDAFVKGAGRARHIRN